MPSSRPRAATVGPRLALAFCALAAAGCVPKGPGPRGGGFQPTPAAGSSVFTQLHAPAGDRPATLISAVDGRPGAILPNGRMLTPTGREIMTEAPRPFALAVAPDGNTALTANIGALPSATLFRKVGPLDWAPTRVDLGATFAGVAFSVDGTRFFVSGGDLGNVWVGDVGSARIIGSVNLNGPAHPLEASLSVRKPPRPSFRGAYPGAMVLGGGRYLYVVDQAAFQVHVVDLEAVVTEPAAAGTLREPNNFAAVVGHAEAGRYPLGIAVSDDGRRLLVTNVGLFQYAHLRPDTPTGDPDADYPLCLPATAYPDDVEKPKTIAIKRIDASRISTLPLELRDPDGIRCGYGRGDRSYTVPALGSPSAPPSSSVYSYSLEDPRTPRLEGITTTGPRVGEVEAGLAAYGGSHPNAVVAGRRALFVSNGNNDSVTVLDPAHLGPVANIRLNALDGQDGRLKGAQPVALALSPDEQLLFVAEAGLNAVAVVDVAGAAPRLLGRIPVGWWPSAVRVAPDGRALYVLNAQGRGAGPNDGEHDAARAEGMLETIDLGDLTAKLPGWTSRVRQNNGFVADAPATPGEGPLPNQLGVPSRAIQHVILINKENATHDLLLGDILATRRGVPVEGDPAFSLGAAASPNHHELALAFTVADNFYLEPAVSSDGHRWLTNSYPTELEELTWPPHYGGGGRTSSGDDPEIIAHYPGRIGFSGSFASPEPTDYNQHGGIYLHLSRHGQPFLIFGNGFEFAGVDEDPHTEPTGIREHVNVPMEKVVRENSDHLYPEFNTSIPDSPLPEEPDRFNRFGRFKQVFEAQLVDRARGICRLPAYVDLYYPNDHGGRASDIHPHGAAWDYTRYVQDNDAALGLTVDLVSKSPCWASTVIFVVEDDTQNGLDHVDGHRSLFLAVSPWVKREYVSKRHLSLASVFKTVDLLLGLPPLNQYDAAASDLRDIFTSTPDLTPYDYRPPAFQVHAAGAWRRLTRGIDFSEPDANEARLRAAIARSEGLPRRPNAAP
jgi:DNA-binding beta-propeller fold protein YncE